MQSKNHDAVHATTKAPHTTSSWRRRGQSAWVRRFIATGMVGAVLLCSAPASHADPLADLEVKVNVLLGYVSGLFELIPQGFEAIQAEAKRLRDEQIAQETELKILQERLIGMCLTPLATATELPVRCLFTTVPTLGSAQNCTINTPITATQTLRMLFFSPKGPIVESLDIRHGPLPTGVTTGITIGGSSYPKGGAGFGFLACIEEGGATVSLARFLFNVQQP